MILDHFTARGARHAYASLGLPLDDAPAHVIWAHGWGRTHADFLGLAGSLERRAHHTLLDFPGFGESPRPADDWSTAEYAEALAAWLAGLPRRKTIYVGHSFGGRVGLRLAARHPELIDGMVLAGAAGLKPQRSLWRRAQIFWRVRAFKTLKLLERLGVDVSRRKARYGSADYRNAGAMRPIFVKVASEDQTEAAKTVRCPVALYYGSLDTEAAPDIGERLSKLIPNARLRIIPGLDHFTILTDGAPQIVHAVDSMLEG